MREPMGMARHRLDRAWELSIFVTNDFLPSALTMGGLENYFSLTQYRNVL